MIREEICTYEVCKLAKEKGFDGSRCLWHYNQKGLLRSNRSFSRFDLIIYDLYHHDTPSEVQVYAPTQSLLQRWLREENGVDIAVVPNISEVYSYIVYDIHCRENRIKDTNAGYATYELALEDALKYALENLV